MPVRVIRSKCGTSNSFKNVANQFGGSGYPLLVGNIGDSPSAAIANRYVNPDGNSQSLQDLDAEFMKSPGPSGAMSGGGSGCGDEGTNTSYKTQTFKDLMGQINSNIDNNMTSLNKQYGGGAAFSVNPEQFIAGRPVIVGYDNKLTPAILNGRYVASSGGPGSSCGQVGGSRRKSKSHRKSKSKSKSKSSRKTKSKSKSKSRKVSRRSRKQQRGGGDFTSVGSSKPAAYCDAFNGPASDLRDPVTFATRNFAGRQPFWGPDAI